MAEHEYKQTNWIQLVAMSKEYTQCKTSSNISIQELLGPSTSIPKLHNNTVQSGLFANQDNKLKNNIIQGSEG